MFNLFNKKSTAGVSDKESAEKIEKVEKDNLDKEIIVHVMPKQFRIDHASASSAKSTGVLILIGGAIFLIAAGFGFYYFIFVYQPVSKSPVVEGRTETNTAPVLTEQPNENLIASSTLLTEGSSTLAEVASTTATTTETSATTTTSQINSTPVVDSDQDGLNDQEEVLIGTDPNKQDTDGDGYNDLAELIKLYNPTGAGGIENALKIKKYTNKDFAYSFLYPSVWTATVLTNDTIKIGPATSVNAEQPTENLEAASAGQFIQINVSENQKKQTISDWYQEQFSQSSIDPNSIITHQDSSGQTDWQGIKNQDGLTVYLTDKNHGHIFTINYDLSLGNTLTFQNIFNLVINSFNIS